MYAIANVIYGILPTPEMRTLFEREFEGNPEEYDAPGGWETFYTGSGSDVPAYLGVKLGEFDECSDPGDDLDDPAHPVNLRPSPKQQAAVDAKIRAFSAAFPALQVPLPRRWILWSTS